MCTMIACLGCYCCLLGLKPRYIELIALIANLIEISFLIWGLVDIPWSDIPSGGKICYLITGGLVVFTFIILIILMILRCSGSINSRRNQTGKCLSIVGCVVDILALIMMIVTEIIIFHKMRDLDYDRNYWGNRRSYSSSGYFTNKEWAAAIFSTSATELASMCHFYCISFLYKLIKYKTNMSYAEYKDKNSPENIYNNNISDGAITAVNVYNNPPGNENNLTFLGYDKDGRPIYAGKNQYRLVNTPVVNQPNVVENNNNNVTNNTDSTDNNNE